MIRIEISRTVHLGNVRIHIQEGVFWGSGGDGDFVLIEMRD